MDQHVVHTSDEAAKLAKIAQRKKVAKVIPLSLPAFFLSCHRNAA